jgi:ribonucleoside-diphosphate reductase alpha chain
MNPTEVVPPVILDDRVEPSLDAHGLYMLRLRYLARDHEDRIIEEPRELFRRVAFALAEAERRFDPQLGDAGVLRWADRFYGLMISGGFLPNAPTLLGAGRPRGQLHACFVLPVSDSVEGLLGALREAGIVHARGGGTGFSFSAVRPRGAPVATGGKANGVVAFMRLFDHATDLIRSGGTGWGANMAVIAAGHPEVFEFVRAKAGGDAMRNFNCSVLVDDTFMESARDPATRAGALLREIAAQAWATGDPGLLFADRIERDNPVPPLGRLEATNPCGEAPLLPYEACCLGGLNAAAFVDPKAREIRWPELDEAAKLGLRMMDNVIDVSTYPLPLIATATHRTRKVGIGVMGFADALVMLGVPYDSNAAEEIAGRLMASIARATHAASEALAVLRGPFPAFGASVFASQGDPPRRNATTTSGPPNSTIGPIAGCSPGIEPLFALSYTKQLENGDRLRTLHPSVRRIAHEYGLSETAVCGMEASGSAHELADVPARVGRILVTAHEIAPEWHLRIQAAFQRHTDLGISKTINLPHEASVNDVQSAYVRAHELGCKGVTVDRDGCADRQFIAVGAEQRKAVAGDGQTQRFTCV